MTGLVAADLRTRHAKIAQEFLSVKGYPSIRPMGVIPIEDDECWYYYYDLPEGILELEVVHDTISGRWHRKVTSFA